MNAKQWYQRRPKPITTTVTTRVQFQILQCLPLLFLISHHSTIQNPNFNFINFSFPMLATMPSSLSPTNTPSFFLRRHNATRFCSSPTFFLAAQRHKNLSLCLSASVADRNLQHSWSSPEENPVDGYGGWAIDDPPVQRKKKEQPTFLIAGIGTSVAVLVAVFAQFSLSGKGFKFRLGSPFQSLHGTVNRNEGEVVQISDSGEFDGNGSVPEAVSDTLISERLERVIIPVAVDSTQQEALAVFKKLKIIEEDIKAVELCTRREYARWLVRINSLLERNPRHKIVPSIPVSGSIISAFDDVSVDDPDFGSIQAIAEAGLIPSKLSRKNSSSDGSGDEGSVFFFPERFISRQDMINWKVQLEYDICPEILEQISRTKVTFMDVKDISSDASPQLFMDMLAGDKSILRKVFGQSKRFQPSLPSTKGQAAVTLMSGRMAEAINTELSRLEAESSSRLAEMEEIRSDLLSRGLIQRFWYEKLEEEKARGIVVERVCREALQALEEEKIVKEKIFSEHLKEKSAMECQKQLLVSLKEEVDEMSERLASETTLYISEQRDLRRMVSILETRLEELLDRKSVVSAKKEAIQILRSWVEDEARKSQARAKVLEEVGRRWKWDDQTRTP